jgi:ParB-like nuclease domain
MNRTSGAEPKGERRVIPRKKLVVDQEFQVRNSLSEEAVGDYMALYAAHRPLPPVWVVQRTDDGNKLYLAEGFHRVAAQDRLGVTAIDALVTVGELDDLYAISAGANMDHGVRRKHSENRNAVEQALKQIAVMPDAKFKALYGLPNKRRGGWSAKHIAAITNLSDSAVNVHRQAALAAITDPVLLERLLARESWLSAARRMAPHLRQEGRGPVLVVSLDERREHEERERKARIRRDAYDPIPVPSSPHTAPLAPQTVTAEESRANAISWQPGGEQFEQAKALNEQFAREFVPTPHIQNLRRAQVAQTELSPLHAVFLAMERFRHSTLSAQIAVKAWRDLDFAFVPEATLVEALDTIVQELVTFRDQVRLHEPKPRTLEIVSANGREVS